MTATDETVEPVSLDDAKRLRDELLASVQDIQAQLADDIRTDGSGRVLTQSELIDWRARARRALNHKLREYREVKQWIAERGRQIRAAQGRNEAASRDFVKSLRMVTGGAGRLVNIYDAAVALLNADTDENWNALEDAVAGFDSMRMGDGERHV